MLGLRGHRVDLLEASAELGGHMRDIVLLPGLGEWGRVVTWREQQLAKQPNVRVIRGVGIVEPEDLLEYGAERIVLATGARWADDGQGPVGTGPIAGVSATHPAFATPEQVLAGKQLGHRVLVLDGDGYFMGVSLAELLADRGHAVTLLTHFDKICPYGDWSHEGANLRRMMRAKGIAEITAHWVERVDVASDLRVVAFDIYRDDWKRRNAPIRGERPRQRGTAIRELEMDSIVLCTSRRSNDALYRELLTRRDRWPAGAGRTVIRTGDCVAPRYIADAVFDGHRVAREFETSNPERPALRNSGATYMGTARLSGCRTSSDLINAS